MLYISILLYLGLSYLIAAKIGKHKTIGFWKTFVLCIIVSPFIGYLIAEGGGRKNARGCNWCGNKYNEAVFCGLCGKNEGGEIRPGFVPRSK
jgi:hypothetical protein